MTDEVIAQDAPEVACDEDELLLVGVVVGDCSVVLDVEELAVVEDPDVVDEPDMEAEVVLVTELAGELVLPAEVVAVDVAW